jgi:hypothetical protein
VSVDGLAFDDLDLYGRELDDPLAELDQDVVHMLLESYQSNPDALERSIGLNDMLSSSSDPNAVARSIEQALRRDDRIANARVTVTPLDARIYRLDLEIAVDEGTLGIALEVDGAGNVRRAV